MRQKFFDVFIFLLILFTLNVLILQREVGILVTKSQNVVQYYAVTGKAVRVLANSYLEWCYSLAETLLNEDKREINTGIGGSRLGPPKNKGSTTSSIREKKPRL